MRCWSNVDGQQLVILFSIPEISRSIHGLEIYYLAFFHAFPQPIKENAETVP